MFVSAKSPESVDVGLGGLAFDSAVSVDQVSSASDETVMVVEGVTGIVVEADRALGAFVVAHPVNASKAAATMEGS